MPAPDPERWLALAWALEPPGWQKLRLFELACAQYGLDQARAVRVELLELALRELDEYVAEQVREAIRAYDPGGLVQRARDYWQNFRPPALPEAERKAHKQARARLAAMSPDELRQTFVKCGIHNPDGTLVEAYCGEPADTEADLRLQLEQAQARIVELEAMRNG